MLKVLDLFSGIGGFSLGLERTGGFKTVAFCEIDPFCRRVLAKHWPEVPVYGDVRELTAERLAADGIAPDVICGGFPCQDISCAGLRSGLEGERSGLWSEYARLIGEIRPQYVIVENVAALLARGLHRVLGDLAAVGFDAEWHCIPASALGAPHRRDRLWLVAYPECQRFRSSGFGCASAPTRGVQETEQEWQWLRIDPQSGCEVMADAEISGWREGHSDARGCSEGEGTPQEWRGPSDSRWWLFEPDVGRVANGVPSRVDRLRALGNAVVPQIPEIIGHAILEARSP